MKEHRSSFVSIILPAYNSSSFILETISSVLNQDYLFWELIIVDDGSSDNTAQLVQGIDPRIILIRQANAGIAAARNTGIQQAQGQLIAFLDHDDYWHPNKLSSQVRALEENPSFSIIYSDFIRWDPQHPPAFPDREIDISKIDRQRSGWIYHVLLQTNWILLTTAIFHRDVFDKIGLFDITLPPADDWDLAIRASRHFQYLRLLQPLALYRVHPHQTSRRADRINHEAILRERMIESYGLDSPNGTRADEAQLKWRQFRAYFNHGLQHMTAGNSAIARQSFRHALRIKPYSTKTWIKYLTSLL